MIVAAHQPGYLPGVSVVAKIARADVVVWLDDVRFTTPGYVNRNQLPDGTWLAVPVERRDHRTPIRDVVIGHDGGDWRRDHSAALWRYHDAAHFDPTIPRILDSEWAAPGAPLVGLNLRMVAFILADLGLAPAEHRQSKLDVAGGGSLSTRLARQVRAVGGTAYLTSPSRALDRDVFAAEGIELLNFEYAGDNPSVIDPLFRTGRLPTTPRQEVVAA